MMDFFNELLLFIAKGAAVAAIFAFIAALLLSRRQTTPRPSLEVTHLNQHYESLADGVRQPLLDKAGWKAVKKQRAAREKTHDTEPRLFVLDFDGDVFASAVRELREEISALLPVLKESDQVLLRLRSNGGGVAEYGLGAEQLRRLKGKSKLTICVDVAACSGGYMMACVADTLVAAPASYIGSIGVVAPVPNVHRLLKKHDIDYEELTAGEFKRTVSTMSEITPAGRAHFQQQLEAIHTEFKDFIKQHRPALDVAQVGNGDFWSGRRAKELGLVDALGTSDDFITTALATSQVFSLNYRSRTPWQERLLNMSLQLYSRLRMPR